MSDEHSHPLLAQVPLTVSPFVSLPTATTLPYTYKSLPSTLPPSSTGPPPSSSNPTHPSGEPSKSKFIVSSSGRAAHPDDIIASCQALQAHLDKLQKDAEQTLNAWEDEIKERELAEKRRVAPGWLDSDEKMLQPERTSTAPASGAVASESLMDAMDTTEAGPKHNEDTAGEELDRAFGAINIKSSG